MTELDAAEPTISYPTQGRLTNLRAPYGGLAPTMPSFVRWGVSSKPYCMPRLWGVALHGSRIELSTLSDDQLRGASVIAGEMMEATKIALQATIDSSRSELLQNAQALGFLRYAIGQERVRRQQEDDCSPLPLPN